MKELDAIISVQEQLETCIRKYNEKIAEIVTKVANSVYNPAYFQNEYVSYTGDLKQLDRFDFRMYVTPMRIGHIVHIAGCYQGRSHPKIDLYIKFDDKEQRLEEVLENAWNASRIKEQHAIQASIKAEQQRKQSERAKQELESIKKQLCEKYGLETI